MNIKERHKKLIERWQLRLGLSDYQMLWLAFAKGLLIGAILL